MDDKQAQLYAVLQTQCEKEAFTIVRPSGKGQGLEAWRRLCRRFDPSTGGRRRAVLRNVLSPSRVGNIEDLSAAVESWEELVRQYENRRKPDGTRPALDDDVKTAILESLCPSEVEKHLQMNQARSADHCEESAAPTWKPGRSEAQAWLTAHTGGPAPMDVGAFQKGGGKHKRQNQRKCHNCGKTGHLIAGCWAPGGGKANANKAENPSTTGDKGGKAKTSKGGPKGAYVTQRKRKRR